MPTKKRTKARETPTRSPASDSLRREYDFRGGALGKYAERYPHGSLVVTLAPDVAAAYPSAAAANDALREMMHVRKPKRRSSSGA